VVQQVPADAAEDKFREARMSIKPEDHHVGADLINVPADQLTGWNVDAVVHDQVRRLAAMAGKMALQEFIKLRLVAACSGDEVKFLGCGKERPSIPQHAGCLA
jgi:hypothetical protein